MGPISRSSPSVSNFKFSFLDKRAQFTSKIKLRMVILIAPIKIVKVGKAHLENSPNVYPRLS